MAEPLAPGSVRAQLVERFEDAAIADDIMRRLRLPTRIPEPGLPFLRCDACGGCETIGETHFRAGWIHDCRRGVVQTAYAPMPFLQIPLDTALWNDYVEGRHRPGHVRQRELLERVIVWLRGRAS